MSVQPSPVWAAAHKIGSQIGTVTQGVSSPGTWATKEFRYLSDVADGGVLAAGAALGVGESAEFAGPVVPHSASAAIIRAGCGPGSAGLRTREPGQRPAYLRHRHAIERHGSTQSGLA